MKKETRIAWMLHSPYGHLYEFSTKKEADIQAAKWEEEVKDLPPSSYWGPFAPIEYKLVL